MSSECLWSDDVFNMHRTKARTMFSIATHLKHNEIIRCARTSLQIRRYITVQTANVHLEVTYTLDALLLSSPVCTTTPTRQLKTLIRMIPFTFNINEQIELCLEFNMMGFYRASPLR